MEAKKTLYLNRAKGTFGYLGKTGKKLIIKRI